VKQLQNVCGYLIVSLLGMLLTKECAVSNRNTLRLQTVFVSCAFKCLLVVFIVLQCVSKKTSPTFLAVTRESIVGFS